VSEECVFVSWGVGEGERGSGMCEVMGLSRDWETWIKLDRFGDVVRECRLEAKEAGGVQNNSCLAEGVAFWAYPR
jgi:hypothetical protein